MAVSAARKTMPHHISPLPAATVIPLRPGLAPAAETTTQSGRSPGRGRVAPPPHGRPANRNEKTDPARILVVDDNATQRLKLTRAVEALGHRAVPVADGLEALAHLQDGAFQVVLLDIVMPRMDGYALLQRMRSDERLRHVPVIVVSALDEMDAVTTAIQLGALDFLPKNFDATLLAARVNASLETLRHRTEDLRTLEQVRRLTAAAAELDSDELNPMRLGIDDMAQRPDPLGRLALVLLNKSISVYNRRQAQLQQIKTLVGVLMLLAMGACLGLKPALSKLHLSAAGHPLTVTFWTMGLVALFIAAVAVVRGDRWPRFTWRLFGFCTVWALLGPVLPQVLLFWAASHVPGHVLAMIMAVEALLVFAVAAAIRHEAPSLRKFAGLCLGVAGILAVLVPEADLGGAAGTAGWLAIALCIQLSMGTRAILLAKRDWADADPVALLATVYGIGAALLLPAVFAVGGFAGFSLSAGPTEAAFLLFAGAEAAGAVLLVLLVLRAGPVFASQKAYMAAIAGVAWSVVLLDESITTVGLAACAVALAGLYLVAQRAPREKLLRPYGGGGQDVRVVAGE